MKGVISTTNPLSWFNISLVSGCHEFDIDLVHFSTNGYSLGAHPPNRKLKEVFVNLLATSYQNLKNWESELYRQEGKTKKSSKD